MYKEMINLFADKSMSSIYVAGYVMALAKKIGAGVSVWHGSQEELEKPVGRLASMMKLMKGRGAQPSRAVLFYGLDPRKCPEVLDLLEADPDAAIQVVNSDVPAQVLCRINAALGLMQYDDLTCLLSIGFRSNHSYSMEEGINRCHA